FDLEDPTDYQALIVTPKLTLSSLEGLIIIDEIQNMPELFPILRVLADRPDNKTRFLILGSASPDLIKNASETLAGRIAFIDMAGFSVNEIKADSYQKLWKRGCFPLSFLSDSDEDGYLWRNNFIRTFLERDIPQLGIKIPANTIRRFWIMMAHYHGQILNSSDIGRSLSISNPTVKHYIDILTGAYMLRQIQPWFENIKKRQVKSPKIYIRDSGLLHNLLSIKSEQILSHPKLGASWEGFVIEQLVTILGNRDYYYWAIHAGSELDLLTFFNGKRIGFEIKFTETPKITQSMHIAINDLKLNKLFVIYPSGKKFLLSDNIIAFPFFQISNLLSEIET
ncbi:MAG: ATP-binding protein, partial [Bacteroidales bacterium]|nr:ATP-binding protein [Bacteroidales bacterium]